MATVAGSSVVHDAGFRFTGSLSVCFPAFNDAPSLPELLRKTFETLERCVTDYEVIVVNDGSSDDTAEVLNQLRRQYAPYLRIVTHEQNQGYGAALRSGFREASKDFIFYTDGDGQYDPSELETLLRAAGSDAGLVNGYKIERHDPWHRIAIGWLYNRFARWLFGIQLRDIDCDFRLIRRSVFEPSALQSTGGTICVELVRQLELSGARVVEVPVHHYPRLHGRSQFFRVKSLASTFLQLLAVFSRLVVTPAFAPAAEPLPGAGWLLLAFLAVIAASFATYARALSLPFIADDYIQIQLGRDFGSFSKWGELAGDVLYRWRATSVVLTHWWEQTFGLSALLFTAAGVALHALNGLMVLALGSWRMVGWRAAAAAAVFFAFSQRHSEAVIWHAALPELLVFFFSMACFLAWVQWLQRGSYQWLWYGLACVSFGLALLSKESAVAAIPLMAVAALAERKPARLLGAVPFLAAGAAYFASIYSAGEAHLHLQDGTFSLSAPFLWVLLRSGAGLLWVWGAVVLLLAGLRLIRPRLALLVIGLAWIPLALLPYSFLTYMTRVPSRHTYLASVGLALIVGAGFVALRRTAFARDHRWLVPAVALLSFLHEAGYVWTVQHDRYIARAEPTELLLRSVSGQDAVYSACFPYSQFVADFALRIAHPDRPALHLEQGPEAARRPSARDFCNTTVEGIRY